MIGALPICSGGDRSPGHSELRRTSAASTGFARHYAVLSCVRVREDDVVVIGEDAERVELDPEPLRGKGEHVEKDLVGALARAQQELTL